MFNSEGNFFSETLRVKTFSDVNIFQKNLKVILIFFQSTLEIKIVGKFDKVSFLSGNFIGENNFCGRKAFHSTASKQGLSK